MNVLSCYLMAPPAFDYSNGRVVIQHGSIFYSPNCSRPVDIPQEPVHSSNPFRWQRLDVSMFKQPVWWDQNWAWQSFIPLAPSFLSFLFAPFEPLCAMPHIEEVRFSFPAPSGVMVTQIRFRLTEDDIRQWLWAEDLLVKAAYELRCDTVLLGTPLSGLRHSTSTVLTKVIQLQSAWPALLGIAKSKNRVAKTAPADPLSAAYSYLLKQPKFDELWLDGLSQSAICTFDWKTPQAGIIFQWSVNDRDRKPIEWSSSGGSHNSKEALLQETEATTDARLEVFKVSQDNSIKAAAHTASSYPYHGLSVTAAPHAAPSVQSQGVPATVRETGRNYNEFFAARNKRQQEMIKLESAVDRQRHKSREQKPGVVNATLFEWEKTQLSGGLELYKRVKVNKKANETVFHSYRSHQRLLNAFSNEWDLCEDFQSGIVDNTFYSDDGYDSGNDVVYPVNAVSQPTKAPPLAAPIDIDMGQSVNDIPPTLSWERMLNFMGFVRNLEELNVGKPKRSAMMNFFAAVLNAVSSYKLDKVVAKNFENLLLLFQFEHVRCPSEDLFVFSSPNPRQVTITEPPTLMWQCWLAGLFYPGWAALLQGGIVGRIAREYVSKDGVLGGPSIEVTAHQHIKVKLLCGHGFPLQKSGYTIALVATALIGRSDARISSRES
ncbi:hypothetical protein B0H34DRAFT_809159 [Crassisporium funariophilum]|nr:hypothetical protein B0H34DRAFT_809159 [Crassisporium funariophilum]